MAPFLTKQALEAWLNKLAGTRTLIAPRREEGLTLFRPVSSAAEIAFDFQNTDISAKEWFFGQSDVLFTVEQKNGVAEITPAKVDKEAVIFGIHPCDALGLSLIDKPFLQEPGDALYRERREKTALIGLACVTASPSCFCSSMGTGPGDASHVDVMLRQAEGGYIAEAVTDKGRALLAEASVAESQNKPLPEPKLAEVPAEGVVAAMPGVFENAYWGKVADRCIHCNVCSYVCPTCYCFDVRDYKRSGKAERVRSWESCQSPAFTRIAGGYDPRPSKAARLRQRFYHKLLYFPKEFGSIACTGCGRCVRSCPVNIDIREIIGDVKKLGVVSGVR